jgi:biopolymer transport protein ExbB
MKLTVPLLALVLAASPLFGQESSSALTDQPILLAQADSTPSKKERAVSAINDRGAAPLADESNVDEVMAIPARTARPAAAEGSEEINATTLWKLVQDGGWAMIPLGFLSIVTVMLVLVFFFTLRRSAILTPHYMNTADVLLKKRDYLGLLAISSRHSEMIARVVQRTLDFATKNPTASIDTVREIAETEGGSQSSSLQHRVVYLADIGMLAPMIGLLGTVMGIINSFGLLGSDQAQKAAQSRDVLLASGVSEALVATASGLILGIFAMFCYGLFRNRVQSLISDLEIATAHIMGLIALNYNKKREQSRVAVDDEF